LRAVIGIAAFVTLTYHKACIIPVIAARGAAGLTRPLPASLARQPLRHNKPVSETRAQPQAKSEQEFLQQLAAATPRVVVTPALLALIVAAFAAMAALGVDVLGARPEDYLRFGANFAPLTTGGEWWRLVTSAFVHIGLLHLAMNLWALYDCGWLAERLFGNAAFAVIFLFAGAAGSCASMLWDAQAITVGASDAIFGVYGALLAFPMTVRGTLPPAAFNRIRVSSSIFVTYSLFYGFTHAGIDNAAHLGGLAGGFAMGLILARPLDAAARHAAGARRAALAAVLAAGTLSATAWLAPETSRVFRQAMEMEKGTAAFNADLARMLAAFNGIVELSQSGKISDAEVARTLHATMLPQWDAAVARLASAEPDADAPLRREYELLLLYARTRRDMIKAVADYLETGDAAHERAVAELRARADDALNQYRKLQRR